MIRRLRFCALFCLIFLVPIGARLTYLQVLAHERLHRIASGEFEGYSLEITPRGKILDRNGKTLAESIPAWSCYLERDLVKDPGRLFRELAPLLGLSQDPMAKKLSRFAWLKRKLNLEQAKSVLALKLKGIGLVPEQERYYPNGSLARSTLGAVDLDGRGLSGIELKFNGELAGRSEKVQVFRDGTGQKILRNPRGADPELFQLRLTLDRNIQHYCETTLQSGIEKFRAKKGMILVQDPSTGELLGLATFPNDPLYNPAVQDLFEPGSTFKAVAAAAALEEKRLPLEEPIHCENGTWKITEHFSIRDHEPSGTLNLAGILARSSNIGISKVALRLSPETFYRYARAFGFGNKSGIQLPSEAAGVLREPAHLSRVSIAMASFGYGISVNALQLIGAYSALANGGALMEPVLIQPAHRDRAPLSRNLPIRKVASPETVRTLQRLLEGAVETGTGIGAGVQGYRIAGKTGTAQKLDPATGRYSSSNHLASFVGFAPSSRPRFTILVLMDSPQGFHYGSEVAAPLFADLAGKLLALKGVPPDRPLGSISKFPLTAQK